MYVSLLQPIIYSGVEGRDKFLLVSFPETTEQVNAFEEQCSTLNAIIFATDKGNVVDIRNNETSLFNIDSMFQKQFRLKPMNSWDFEQFQEHLGNNINWGIITARAFAGRSEVAKEMAKLTSGRCINMETVAEECKKRLKDPEAEEFEGDVPIEEIQKDICAMVKTDQASGSKCCYVFDGFAHKSAKDFMAWANASFGCPSYWLPVTCDNAAAGERWKKQNEADEVGEEAQEEINGGEAAFATESEAMAKELEGTSTKSHAALSTGTSMETTITALKALTCAKIVIVNHDPRLPVDVSCANLAIKYNMLYLSVHQLIREHITKHTSFGVRL